MASKELDNGLLHCFSETSRKTRGILTANSGRKSVNKRISWGNMQIKSYCKHDSPNHKANEQDRHQVYVEIPLASEDSSTDHLTDERSIAPSHNASSMEFSGHQTPNIQGFQKSTNFSEPDTETKDKDHLNLSYNDSYFMNGTSLKLSETPLNKFDLQNLSFNASGMDMKFQDTIIKDDSDKNSFKLPLGFLPSLSNTVRSEEGVLQTPQKPLSLLHESLNFSQAPSVALNDLFMSTAKLPVELHDAQDPSFMKDRELSMLLFNSARRPNKRSDSLDVANLLSESLEIKEDTCKVSTATQGQRQHVSQVNNSNKKKRMSDYVGDLLGIVSVDQVTKPKIEKLLENEAESVVKQQKELSSESEGSTNTADYLNKFLSSKPVRSYIHNNKEHEPAVDSIRLNQSIEEKLNYAISPVDKVREKGFISASPLMASLHTLNNTFDSDKDLSRLTDMTSALGLAQYYQSEENSQDCISPPQNKEPKLIVPVADNKINADIKSIFAGVPSQIEPETKKTILGASFLGSESNLERIPPTNIIAKESPELIPQQTLNKSKIPEELKSNSKISNGLAEVIDLQSKEEKDSGLYRAPFQEFDSNSFNGKRVKLSDGKVLPLVQTNGISEFNQRGQKENQPPHLFKDITKAGLRSSLQPDSNDKIQPTNSVRPHARILNSELLKKQVNQQAQTKQNMLNPLLLKSPKINRVQKNKLLDFVSPSHNKEKIDVLIQKLAESKRYSDNDWVFLKRNKIQAWREVLRSKLKNLLELTFIIKTVREKKYEFEDRIKARKENLKLLIEAQNRKKNDDERCSKPANILKALSTAQKRSQTLGRLTQCQLVSVKNKTGLTKYEFCLLNRIHCKVYQKNGVNLKSIERFAITSSDGVCFDTKNIHRHLQPEDLHVIKDKQIMRMMSGVMMNEMKLHDATNFITQMAFEFNSLVWLSQQIEELQKSHTIANINFNYECNTVSFTLVLRHIPFKLIIFKIKTGQFWWNQIRMELRLDNKKNGDVFAKYVEQTYENIDKTLATIFNQEITSMSMRNLVSLVSKMDNVRLGDIK